MTGSVPIDAIVRHWNKSAGAEVPVHADRLIVVMSNYNDRAHIEESLCSILAQLTDGIALLFIDDGSNDDSIGVARACLYNETRATILENPGNQGVVASYNAALRMVDAPYIYFASANDRIAEGFLCRVLRMLRQRPSAGLGSALTQRISMDGSPLDVMRTALPSCKPTYLPPREVTRLLIRQGAWIVGCSTIYRTEALRQVGGFDPALHGATDSVAATRIALAHGVCFLPRIGAYWRVSEGGYASRGLRDAAMVQDILRAGTGAYARIQGGSSKTLLDFWRRELAFWHLRATRDAATPPLATLAQEIEVGSWRVRLLNWRRPKILWTAAAILLLAPFKVGQAFRRRLRWRGLAERDLAAGA